MSRRSSAKAGAKRGKRKHVREIAPVDEEAPEVEDTEEDREADVVQDGFVLDFISGSRELKETPKELVRQRIARALFHEYGISVDDMEADFSVSVGGRRRRVGRV